VSVLSPPDEVARRRCRRGRSLLARGRRRCRQHAAGAPEPLVGRVSYVNLRAGVGVCVVTAGVLHSGLPRSLVEPALDRLMYA
jgi:hypothetical protein